MTSYNDSDKLIELIQELDIVSIVIECLTPAQPKKWLYEVIWLVNNLASGSSSKLKSFCNQIVSFGAIQKLVLLFK